MLTTRILVFAVVVVAFGQFANPRAGICDTDQRRPNIVFVLVDDLGWKDLGSYGSSFYCTPNVDKLAVSGMRFTAAYAACPVCSPTRASIMTGKYPPRVGITDYINPSGHNQPDKWNRATKLLPARYRDHLPLEEITIARRLKQEGYATFFAGKWHLGGEGFLPEDHGFDVNMGGLARGGPYGGNKYFSPYGNDRLPDGPEGEHLPDRLASETVTFIEANKDRPFFAFLSFYSVHTPLMAREDLKQKYLAKKASLRPTGPIWGREGKRKLRLVQEHSVYAGMVEAMDLAVGKVLDALDRLNLVDNTIIIFTSDNGGLSTSEGHPTSNIPLRAGKGWIYEGGIRVPMMVRAPNVTRPGTVCDDYTSSVDFYPTIIELAGIAKDRRTEIDGRSFVTTLTGQSTERGPIFWHYPHYGNQGGAPVAAVRDKSWKLIHWFEDDSIELFDLSKDIGETHNLAADNPEIVGHMKKLLSDWQKHIKAQMPTTRLVGGW